MPLHPSSNFPVCTELRQINSASLGGPPPPPQNQLSPNFSPSSSHWNLGGGTDSGGEGEVDDDNDNGKQLKDVWPTAKASSDFMASLFADGSSSSSQQRPRAATKLHNSSFEQFVSGGSAEKKQQTIASGFDSLYYANDPIWKPIVEDAACISAFSKSVGAGGNFGTSSQTGSSSLKPIGSAGIGAETDWSEFESLLFARQQREDDGNRDEGYGLYGNISNPTFNSSINNDNNPSTTSTRRGEGMVIKERKRRDKQQQQMQQGPATKHHRGNSNRRPKNE